MEIRMDGRVALITGSSSHAFPRRYEGFSGKEMSP